MPAKRAPWFKFWHEAIKHEKVALLSDAAFRTWVHAMAEGSQQPVRARFASAKHCARVTGRPIAHIRQLIAKRLIDEAEDGSVIVHDWGDWNDVYPSDLDRPPRGKHSEKTPPSLREDSAKTPRRGEKGEGRREKTLSPGLETSPAGGSPPGGTAPAADAAAPPTAKANGMVSQGDVADLEPLLQAFDRLGLKRPPLVGKFEAQDARALLAVFEPGEIAECWQAVACGEWGDAVSKRELSFSWLSRNNRVGNWQRQRQSAEVDDDALVGPVNVVRV